MEKISIILTAEDATTVKKALKAQRLLVKENIEELRAELSPIARAELWAAVQDVTRIIKLIERAQRAARFEALKTPGEHHGEH